MDQRQNMVMNGEKQKEKKSFEVSQDIWKPVS